MFVQLSWHDIDKEKKYELFTFYIVHELNEWGTLAYFMSCRWYSIWPVVSVAPS